MKNQKLKLDIGKLFTLDELLNQLVWVKIVEVLKKLVSKFTFFDYSEKENKSLTIQESLLFYELSNATRISQEPSRSRVSRMRSRVNEIYQKYSENKKAKELIDQMNLRLDESLKFITTIATVLSII